MQTGYNNWEASNGLLVEQLMWAGKLWTINSKHEM